MRRDGISALKKRLDKIFSQWIRMREADFGGYAQCFTCGVRKPWKELQAGHYVPRNIGALRYEPRNVHVQCVKCNIWDKGKMDVYAINLQRKYGMSILLWLNEHRKDKPPGIKELRDMIAYYNDELSTLL